MDILSQRTLGQKAHRSATGERDVRDLRQFYCNLDCRVSRAYYENPLPLEGFRSAIR
jgi:hypothetical protein